MELQERLNVLFEALDASGLGSQGVLQVTEAVRNGTWDTNIDDGDPITAAIVMAVMNETNGDVDDIVSELEYTKSTLHSVIYKIKS